MAIIAQDDWTRTSASGWGNADIGGTYAGAGGQLTSVSGGLGVIGPISNAGRQVQIVQAVSAEHALATVDVSTDITATGLTILIHSLARVIDADNNYLAELQLRDAIGGNTRIRVLRRIGGVKSTVFNGPALFPHQGGQVMRIGFEVSGFNPTRLRAKVYRVGIDADPGWQIDADDPDSATTAALLQNHGFVGLGAERGGGGSPVFRFDAWQVDSIGTPGPITLAGTVPIIFTVTGSTDTPTTLAGTIPIEIGVSGDLEQGGAAVFARDRFIRSVAGGWGTSEIGGHAWVMDLKVHVDPPDPPDDCDDGLPPGFTQITGGDGGTLYEIRTAQDFVDAAEATGARYLLGIGSGALNITPISGINGINVVNPNMTIDFRSCMLNIRGGDFKLSSGNHKIMGVSFRPGDVGMSGTEAASTHGAVINPSGGRVADNIAFIQCEFMWAPDVNFVIRPAGASPMQNYLVDRCIMANGLIHSNHSEGRTDDVGTLDGHALACNVVGPIDHVLFWRTLLTTNQGRNFRLIKVSRAEVINCAIYNYDEPMTGLPESAHVIGCLWKRGPAPASKGFAPDDDIWKFQGSAGTATGNYFTPNPDSLYIADVRAEGFTPTPNFSTDARVQTMLRDTPHPDIGAGSVIARPSSETAGIILNCAGVPLKDAVSQQLLDDFLDNPPDVGFVYGFGNYPPIEGPPYPTVPP